MPHFANLGLTNMPAPPTTSNTLAAAEVKARLRLKGQTVKEWAKTNGYRFNEVYRVLNGQSKARYGQGHEIAVKLGLKCPEDQQQVAA